MPATMTPPTAPPTMAPSRVELLPPSADPEEEVSAGWEVPSVVVKDDDPVWVVHDVLQVGVRTGDLLVTIVVFFVTVTLERFGIVRVVPESVMVVARTLDSVVRVMVNSAPVAVAEADVSSSAVMSRKTGSGQSSRWHGSTEQHPLKLLVRQE